MSVFLIPKSKRHVEYCWIHLFEYIYANKRIEVELLTPPRMFDTPTNWYAKNPQYFQETRMMQEHIMKRIPPDPSDQSDFLQQTIRICEMYQKHLMWSSRYRIKTKAF